MTTITREQYVGTKGGQAFLALAQNFKCGQCRKKFDKPWAVPTGQPYPNNVALNPEIAFHWEDTHGFPHDMLYSMVRARIWDFTPLDSQNADEAQESE